MRATQKVSPQFLSTPTPTQVQGQGQGQTRMTTGAELRKRRGGWSPEEARPTLRGRQRALWEEEAQGWRGTAGWRRRWCPAGDGDVRGCTCPQAMVLRQVLVLVLVLVLNREMDLFSPPPAPAPPHPPSPHYY